VHQFHYLRESIAYTHKQKMKEALISLFKRIKKILHISFSIKAQVVMTEKWNNMKILVVQLTGNAIS